MLDLCISRSLQDWKGGEREIMAIGFMESPRARHIMRPVFGLLLILMVGVAPSRATAPVRVGTMEYSKHVELEVHEETGNLLAVVRYNNGSPAVSYGWAVLLSVDTGITWNQTFSSTRAEPSRLSATIVGDYLYVVTEEDGAASGLVDIRRFSVTTGASDPDFGFFTVVDVGSGQLYDMVLFGNTDESDSIIYLALIERSGALRFFWAVTALFDPDDATADDWNEYRAGSGGTGVTDANWRLDGSFSAGGASPYAIFVTYTNTEHELCVWRLSQVAHDARVLVGDYSDSETRVAADRDKVIVTYGHDVSFDRDVRYHVSEDAGETWSSGTLAAGGSGVSYPSAAVSARWNRGMFVVYDRMGGGGDALFSARRPVEEDVWTTPVSPAGLSVRTGTRKDAQPLVGGGWGILFISDTGDPQSVYFMPSPLIFSDGFASANLSAWSSAAP
jgi:hypothetical protein